MFNLQTWFWYSSIAADSSQLAVTANPWVLGGSQVFLRFCHSDRRPELYFRLLALILHNPGHLLAFRKWDRLWEFSLLHTHILYIRGVHNSHRVNALEVKEIRNSIHEQNRKKLMNIPSQKWKGWQNWKCHRRGLSY